jgi:GNAT superfamily N-acetyltransferase
VEIREVDVHDDVLMRALYDMESRAVLNGREGMPHWSWSEFAAVFQKPDPGEDFLLVAGWEDGRLVGSSTLFMPTMDNLDKGWVDVQVHPAHQRRGHGRALLDATLARADAEGRTVLIETKVPFAELEEHGYRRFAERAGFRYSNVEVVRHLDLPVPGMEIAEWEREAAVKARGYRLETHVDGVPDELLPSYLELLGLLAVDAPTGEVDYEQEVMTPERYWQNQESLKTAGRTIYESLAVTDTDDGPVVAAHSTISVPALPKTDLSQWGTFVHRDHRGHRLGLATKALNLKVVQRAHPEMRRIVTQNAETNQWMIAVNVRMGFEPVEASLELVRDRAGS